MSAAPAPASTTPSSLLRMAAPLVVSFWMRAAVTFVDTIYAALLGDAAVASIGLAIPFEFVMIAVWVGLSTGLTSGLSRAMGARETAKIEQYLRLTWRLVATVSPLFTVVGVGIWLAAPHAGLDAEVARKFQIYGSVLIGGSAFTTFWSVIPDSLVKAHHDTRATMWAGIWTNVLNLTLNTLFLFAFHWGIFGIALSTVIARLGGLVYAMAAARRHERRRAIEWRADPRTSSAVDPFPYRRVLGLAIPASLTFVLMALEGALVNGLLAAGENSTEAIAAYSIYYRIVLFALQPVIAVSVAMLPYAGRRLGEGDLDGVRRGVREALGAGALYAVAFVAPVLLALAPWISDRMSESPLTREYALFALRAVPLACLFGTPFLVSRPVFEAMGRGNPGLWMAALRYLVLTGPAAWLGLRLAAASARPPLEGLIVALIAVSAIASAAFYAWLRATLSAVDPDRDSAPALGGS